MSGDSSRRYPPELRERAVRMVAEIRDQHESEWAAMSEVSRVARGRHGRDGAQVGAPGRGRCRVASGDDDRGVRGAEAAEAGERRTQARQRDSEDGVGFLRGRTRPATPLIARFIAEHQGHRDGPDGLRWGVESICAQLTELGVQIAPSTYYEHVDRAAQPPPGPRRGPQGRDRAGARRQLRGLRGPQGVAGAQP